MGRPRKNPLPESEQIATPPENQETLTLPPGILGAALVFSQSARHSSHFMREAMKGLQRFYTEEGEWTVLARPGDPIVKAVLNRKPSDVAMFKKQVEILKKKYSDQRPKLNPNYAATNPEKARRIIALQEEFDTGEGKKIQEQIAKFEKQISETAGEEIYRIDTTRLKADRLTLLLP